MHLMKSDGFITRRVVIIWLVVYATTYMTIMSLTNSYDWWTFYTQKFIAKLAYPLSEPVTFDLRAFLRYDIQGWIATFYRDYRLFLLILFTVLMVRSGWGVLLDNHRSEVAVLIAIALSIPIRLALYPIFLNRMAMIPIAILLIMSVKISPVSLKGRAVNP